MKTEKQLLDERLLWQSAEHWLENWTHPEHASTSPDKCACCRNYFVRDHPCLGCPISEYAGKTNCEGTHYYLANNALRSYRYASGSMKEFQGHAEAMYVLLVELALSLGQGGTDED